jgi:hypothetical protein
MRHFAIVFVRIPLSSRFHTYSGHVEHVIQHTLSATVDEAKNFSKYIYHSHDNGDRTQDERMLNMQPIIFKLFYQEIDF